MSKPTLWWHTELTNDGNAEGRLEIWDVDSYPEITPVERFIAISGLEGFQLWHNQNSRGRGPIPRSDVAGIKCYQVATKPVWVSAEEQPGIAGNFYEISPTFIENGRGLFGIHFDANVRGSAGCVVVVNADAWVVFEQCMLHYHKQGIEQIPLMVGYS